MPAGPIRYHPAISLEHVRSTMSWFEKIMPSRIKTERRTRSVPEGLWIKCPACDAVLYRAELERNLYVCPKCSHHMRIGGPRAAGALPGSGRRGRRSAPTVAPEDPLKFRDSKRYKDRLVQAQKATGETDALIVLAGTLHGAADRGVRVRVPVPRRLDGLGGRRAIQARASITASSIASRSCASRPAAARACRRRCTR